MTLFRIYEPHETGPDGHPIEWHKSLKQKDRMNPPFQRVNRDGWISIETGLADVADPERYELPREIQERLKAKFRDLDRHRAQALVDSQRCVIADGS